MKSAKGYPHTVSLYRWANVYKHTTNKYEFINVDFSVKRKCQLNGGVMEWTFANEEIAK